MLVDQGVTKDLELTVSPRSALTGRLQARRKERERLARQHDEVCGRLVNALHVHASYPPSRENEGAQGDGTNSRGGVNNGDEPELYTVEPVFWSDGEGEEEWGFEILKIVLQTGYVSLGDIETMADASISPSIDRILRFRTRSDYLGIGMALPEASGRTTCGPP